MICALRCLGSAGHPATQCSTPGLWLGSMALDLQHDHVHCAATLSCREVMPTRRIFYSGHARQLVSSLSDPKKWSESPRRSAASGYFESSLTDRDDHTHAHKQRNHTAHAWPHTASAWHLSSGVAPIPEQSAHKACHMSGTHSRAEQSAHNHRKGTQHTRKQRVLTEARSRAAHRSAVTSSSRNERTP